MNTPAHAILNLVILNRDIKHRRMVPVVTGAIIPDIPVIFFYGLQKLVLSRTEQTIWQEIYFRSFWQNIFDVFNAIPLILLGWLTARKAENHWLQTFFTSMLLHALFDFGFHNDDAHRHFFPILDFRFKSPLSYWDPDHFGHFVASGEIICVLAASFFLITRFVNRKVKSTVLALLAGYAVYYVYALSVWV